MVKKRMIVTEEGRAASKTGSGTDELLSGLRAIRTTKLVRIDKISREKARTRKDKWANSKQPWDNRQLNWQ